MSTTPTVTISRHKVASNDTFKESFRRSLTASNYFCFVLQTSYIGGGLITIMKYISQHEMKHKSKFHDALFIQA